jgi:putative ABC transport system permease protein
MRPQWRLAIKNLSARRSRTALLVAVVAFSCALVVGITGALEAVTGAIVGQVEATVGTADVRVRAATGGRVFDVKILDQIRTWGDVDVAEGRLQSAITLSAERDALVERDGAWVREPRKLIANAAANARSGGEAATALIVGRQATAAGEIVTDAQLASQLSMRASKDRKFKGASVRVGVNASRVFESELPSLPERTLDAQAAGELNDLVGVRIGERVSVVRQALPPMNVSAIVSNPARALRVIKSMGTTFNMPGLKALGKAPVELTIVGIAQSPPLGGRAQAYMTLETLNMIVGEGGAGSVDQIDITLKSGVEPEAFVKVASEKLGRDYLVQTTSKVTAGLDRNMDASRLGVLLASVLGFLASSFIIMTGMTTGVTERTRELGVLRAIGATKWQLAEGQLVGGFIVGLLGATVGVPMGLGLAWGLVELLQSQLDVKFVWTWNMIGVAVGGAVMSGLIGAAFPAWRATTVSPLEAIASRGKGVKRAHVLRIAFVGLILIAVQAAIITMISDGQRTFWTYAIVGVPALFTGWFLLSVPVTALAAKFASGVVSRALGLPPKLLERSMLRTPYRNGFTAGSLMTGLALMVAIWTQGGAVRRDWIGNIAFPDAFVTGLNLTPESREIVQSMPFVQDVTAIAIKPVEVDAFGVQALQKYKTSFMAFEPRKFFSMTKITWLEGDPEVAIEKLERGGAVIVAREFKVAKGLGVGDTFVCMSDGVEHRFEIVGVVTSPGLEMVSKFFNVGEDFMDQALHAVFGSRKDLKDKLKSESIHLLQIAFKPDTDEDAAMETIRSQLAGAGILDAGSGRRIKETIMSYADGALFAISMIGVAAMAVASFGVANLIIAAVRARMYEFGVLRALGAERWMVSRLVLGEAIIIAVGACITGTLMGVQGALGGKRLDEAIMGIRVNFELPWTNIAVGCGIVVLMSVCAALPAVMSLGRRSPRDLLGAMKGG